MSIFIDPDATEVVEFQDPEGGTNRVWIKAKMDYGTKAKVQRDMMQMSFDEASASGGVEEVRISASPALRELAFLKHNIVRWDGPLFRRPGGRGKYPCKPEWIARLDLDASRYWIDLVLDKIFELNGVEEDQPTEEEEEILLDEEADPNE